MPGLDPYYMGGVCGVGLGGIEQSGRERQSGHIPLWSLCSVTSKRFLILTNHTGHPSPTQGAYLTTIYGISLI